MKRFHYSQYWGIWSRVLASYENGNVPGDAPAGTSVVELNLTPVNPLFGWSWEEQVKPVVIRAHYTANRPGDKNTDDLPGSVVNSMKSALGPELTEFLLTNENIIPVIDWDKFRRNNNGGCQIRLCLLSTAKEFLVP